MAEIFYFDFSSSKTDSEDEYEKEITSYATDVGKFYSQIIFLNKTGKRAYFNKILLRIFSLLLCKNILLFNILKTFNIYRYLIKLQRFLTSFNRKA